jgi:hypothetical protein
MNSGRRLAARVLATVGLAFASLSLSAWWGQAIAAGEVPVLTSMAQRAITAEVTAQLEAQARSADLPRPVRQGALDALDSPAVRHAITAGDPGPAVEAALVKADPALAPVLKNTPLSAPGIGRLVIREGRRIRPLAEEGSAAAIVACALAFVVAADRFVVLRRVGRWGILAGATSLLVGWVLPVALGLEHRPGDTGALARAGLAATVPLRAVSETLVVTGLVMVAVGALAPMVLRRRSAPASQVGSGQPGAPGAVGALPRSPRSHRRGAYGAISSSSKVDVRL